MRGINTKATAKHDDSPVADEVEGEDVTKEDAEEEWEKGIPPFVRKLTKMVSENPDAIDWTPSGSFIVKEIDAFGSTLLPKYFKSIKFCSFVRFVLYWVVVDELSLASRWCKLSICTSIL